MVSSIDIRVRSPPSLCACFTVTPPAWLTTASEETKKRMQEHFAAIKGKTLKAQSFTLGMMRKLYMNHIKEHPEQLGATYWLHHHKAGGHHHHHKDEPKPSTSKGEPKPSTSKEGHKHEGAAHKHEGKPEAKGPKGKHEGGGSPKGGKKPSPHGPTRL